jgi:hypothetical protein
MLSVLHVTPTTAASRCVLVVANRCPRAKSIKRPRRRNRATGGHTKRPRSRRSANGRLLGSIASKSRADESGSSAIEFRISSGGQERCLPDNHVWAEIIIGPHDGQNSDCSVTVTRTGAATLPSAANAATYNYQFRQEDFHPGFLLLRMEWVLVLEPSAMPARIRFHCRNPVPAPGYSWQRRAWSEA